MHHLNDLFSSPCEGRSSGSMKSRNCNAALLSVAHIVPCVRSKHSEITTKVLNASDLEEWCSPNDWIHSTSSNGPHEHGSHNH